MTPEDVALMELHFTSMLSTPLQLSFRGQVPDYIDRTLRFAAGKGEHFSQWQLDQKALIEKWHTELQVEQKTHEKEVLRVDPALGPINTRIQLPLMLKLMSKMGMSPQTRHFVKTGFTSGFRYAEEVPLTGLYNRMPEGKELGSLKGKNFPDFSALNVPLILRGLR